LCIEHKTIKLVQASTIDCSSSAMLEQHGSTSSSRLARHVERVESSGIWALETGTTPDAAESEKSDTTVLTLRRIVGVKLHLRDRQKKTCPFVF